MDLAVNGARDIQPRRILAWVAFAPITAQLVSSVFNIVYNVKIIDPLLRTQELKDRFQHTLVGYNAIIYPLAVYVWVRIVYSLRPSLERLARGESVPADEMEKMQRRVVHLPWWGALLSSISWLGCIPVFLLSLAAVGHALDPLLLWHFPISIVISTLIATTHGIFWIEAISYRRLFPAFFRDSRSILATGRLALSVRSRGILWAVSIGICPIASLLLLNFAPLPPGTNAIGFAVFVAIVGVAFGLLTAILLSNLVARPIDELKAAARDVAAGKYNRRIPAARPDEFGQLLAAFDHMLEQLREKERLRQTFGLHVGRAAAEQILTRDPGLGGIEQTITVLFADIRGFTTRSAVLSAPHVVSELNEFLRVMVHVVEERNGGMINKFLGDGFMALFGVGGEEAHAASALRAASDMVATLDELNARFAANNREPLQIGVGIHTGPAVVGSIGSPQRLEFTAIGNTVNIAARLQELTKELRVAILLTEETARHLPRSERLAAVGPREIRGLPGPIPLYTAGPRSTISSAT